MEHSAGTLPVHFYLCYTTDIVARLQHHGYVMEHDVDQSILITMADLLRLCATDPSLPQLVQGCGAQVLGIPLRRRLHYIHVSTGIFYR